MTFQDLTPNVLHVGKYFPPFSGGIENFVGDLLPALARNGVKVAALVHQSPGSSKKEFVKRNQRFSGIDLRYASCYGTLVYAPISPGFPFALNRILKERRPDIIHLHVPNTSAFWVLFLARAARIPWVIHWHSDVVASSIDRRLALAYSFYRPFEQRLLARAAAVVCTSENYMASSPALAPWQRKCRVIPLGIDPERLPVPEPACLDRMKSLWGDAKKCFRVLAIGRLTYYKGHDVLIRALAKTDGIQLVIAGEGELRHELAGLVEKLGLKDRVRLAGLLSDEELQGLLAASDCLCLPSVERTEAFGLVLLEAMRYGKPLICADVPGSGMGWVVQDGVNGFHFPVADVQSLAGRLGRLATETAQCEEFGVAGHKRFVSSFHIDRIAEKTMELYNHVLRSEGNII